MRLWLLPEINKRLAPVEFVIVSLPAVEAELMTNSPSPGRLLSVIVQMVLLQLEIAKSMVSSASEEFARVIASRKLPEPMFAVVVTV